MRARARRYPIVVRQGDRNCEGSGGVDKMLEASGERHGDPSTVVERGGATGDRSGETVGGSTTNGLEPGEGGDRGTGDTTSGTGTGDAPSGTGGREEGQGRVGQGEVVGARERFLERALGARREEIKVNKGQGSSPGS